MFSELLSDADRGSAESLFRDAQGKVRARKAGVASSKMKICAVLLLILTGCAAPRVLTPAELANSDAVITEIQKAPVEYQLAYLDSGRLPRGNNVNAARIRFLLKSVSEKTSDSRQAVADRTSAAVALSKKNMGKRLLTRRFLKKQTTTSNLGKKLATSSSPRC